MKSETLNIPGLPHAAISSNSQPAVDVWGCRLLSKNRIRLAVIAASIAVFGLPDRAVAQIAIPTVTLVQISGPSQAFPTEHLSFCYSMLDYPYTPENGGSSESGESFFLPRKKATVTLRIIEATTGSEKVKKVILLIPGALPSDPCVEFVVPVPTISSASSVGSAEAVLVPSLSVYIGVVSVSGQPLPPSAVTSSLHIFSLGSDGLPVNSRVIPASVTCPADEFPCSY